MKQEETVLNYQFINADPDIYKYLPKFIEGTNNEIINQNLINSQIGFLDSAACKNANEPPEENQKNINIVFENKKEDFSKENIENTNSKSSTFEKIINWIIIAFFIIFGLLILGYSGIID